jgi:hypothetical protein
MTAPAATAANKPTEKTSYIVLVKKGGEEWEAGEEWEVVDAVHATSATAAIRAVATDHVNGPRTYVAVPARSWKPVTAQLDTKTVLTLT